MAFAPPGLLIIMIGCTEVVVWARAWRRGGSAVACFASRAAGSASALGFASPGVASAGRVSAFGGSSFGAGWTGSEDFAILLSSAGVCLPRDESHGGASSAINAI